MLNIPYFKTITTLCNVCSTLLRLAAQVIHSSFSTGLTLLTRPHPFLIFYYFSIVLLCTFFVNISFNVIFSQLYLISELKVIQTDSEGDSKTNSTQNVLWLWRHV